MINFLKYRRVYLVISTFFLGIGIFSIIFWGYNYSIDFVGGTNMDYSINPGVSTKTLTKIFSEQGVSVLQISEKNGRYFIRTKALDEKKEPQIRQAIEKITKSKVVMLKSETVGPSIGRETVDKTLIASAIAMLGILLYVAYAFRNLNFAVAAIAALFHDMLVVVGMYSLFSHFLGAELDSLFVTALLTTMSFSVHDTIVVFDQIRDYRKKHGVGDIENYANRALTDTMVRSFNNSMTIIFMLVALVVLGGTTIRFFALTLLVGTITGTYSSPFVATPIAVWLEKRKK